MRSIMLYCLILCLAQFVQAQKIDRIIDYTPAPGQFINVEHIGRPLAAQNLAENGTGIVTLGAYGGHITFAWNDAVKNDPKNPYGIDFILYGNALPELAEPGIVYVMKDENQNEIADDTWYEIAGSEYHFSQSRSDYQITYFQPVGKMSAVPWRDNFFNTGEIKRIQAHRQAYYPQPEYFADYPQDSITFNGTEILIDSETNSIYKSFPRQWGYADNHRRGNPSAETIPNPYRWSLTGKGGDGIDISWAVDEDGNYVDLDEINFVKIMTGINGDLGPLGEISSEFTGAIATSPTDKLAGEYYCINLSNMPRITQEKRVPFEIVTFINGRKSSLPYSITTEPVGASIVNDEIVFDKPGTYTVNASLADSAHIYVEATIIYEESSSISQNIKQIDLYYPVPSNGILYKNSIDVDKLELYDISGMKRMDINTRHKILDLTQLPPGFYIMKASYKNQAYIQKIILK